MKNKYRNLSKQGIRAIPDHELMMDRANYKTALRILDHLISPKEKDGLRQELKVINCEITNNRPKMNADLAFK